MISDRCNLGTKRLAGSAGLRPQLPAAKAAATRRPTLILADRFDMSAPGRILALVIDEDVTVTTRHQMSWTVLPPRDRCKRMLPNVTRDHA